MNVLTKTKRKQVMKRSRPYVYAIYVCALLVLGLGRISHAELRPLATDRPDATESPITVDKGHFQIESSIAGYVKDGDDSELILMESNIKYGVTDNVDLQLVIQPYLRQWIEGSNDEEDPEDQTDIGDVDVRVKINLWGNDDADNAFGLLPYVKIPTGKFSNDEFEGGLIATYATSYGGYGIGIQGQVDLAYDEDHNDHDLAGSHTLVVGYDISERLGIAGYLEYLGDKPVDANYAPYFDFGFTMQTSDNFQWDIGSQWALSDEGTDRNLFIGFTARH